MAQVKAEEREREHGGRHRKVALITGITGQDGSYLTELLLEKGYEVHGIVRRSSSINTGRIDHLIKDVHETTIDLTLHFGDLCDGARLTAIVAKVRPTEIYNLGALSHVKVSFDMPAYAGNSIGLGTLRMLDAVRTAGLERTVRFYQASTSELFGKVKSEAPQNEDTPFYPHSPYAVAKLFAHSTVINYREAYKMHLTNGILFNHESPRRGRTYVTRKISVAVASILENQQKAVYLGRLDAKRDWGHSRDYVRGMWLMLQQDKPDDYVLATGVSHTVREFVEKAFAVGGITLQWKGPRGSVDEIGVDAASEGRVLVRIDPRYFRPTEADLLLGDATKARNKLGWSHETSFDELVREMVESDLALLRGKKNVAATGKSAYY